MIVRYWHPFQEVETLSRQFDRVFNDVSNAIELAPTTWTPAVRLIETADNYVVTVQLAGIDPDTIDIQATRETVAITGERPQPEVAESDRILHDDLRYGTFRRVVNLPKPVQNDAVTADFNNGLLTLTLPKVEEVRNKVVKINLGLTDSIAENSSEADA